MVMVILFLLDGLQCIYSVHIFYVSTILLKEA